MPTELSARETRYVATGEVADVAVDFTGLLRDGDTITGTPTVAQSVGVTGMTFGAVTLNTARMKINGRFAEPAMAVQFRLTVATSTGTCQVKVTVSLTSGQTRVRFLDVIVAAA